jgi:Bacteriophage HK97-gp10, putative tail-component
MANGGGFFILADSISPFLENVSEYKAVAMDMAEGVADRMLASAKDNAPWADRTGAARQGLETEVTDEGDVIVVTLMHTVDYGQWLETIQSGRFAIIMPTLEQYAAEIHRVVAGGMFGGEE